ncbi:MAG: MerR family transcriptional regulator [Candidatus Dadabacteria bacterium]|nr:MAG: MerR family transcriptional regulator [Candidatus Dadabacteria bacterium]
MAGQIPDGKLYFKIGEVAKIVGVKPYVLRYWETEFSMLRPGKTRSRHRLYRRKDVELLMRIKELLHDQRYTIEGARKQLRAEAEQARSGWPSQVQLRELRKIRDELVALRDSLS